MKDSFNRQIDYLRVSVIDRCDQRCVYCMPEEGVALKRHEDILSYEQIEQVVRTAVPMGITKVRLTGGEPLIRRGIESLTANLAAIDGLSELTMTTNGTRLTAMAAKLKDAGLHRLNISMDSAGPDKYREITRGGDVSAVIAGIDATIAAGFENTKINMVIFRDTTESEVDAMQAFCAERGVRLQKIMQFSLYDRDDLTMRFAAERPPRCSECNRLRLTADGYFKPCLFSEDEIKVNFSDIEESILTAIGDKPESGTSCATRNMSQIGG